MRATRPVTIFDGGAFCRAGIQGPHPCTPKSSRNGHRESRLDFNLIKSAHLHHGEEKVEERPGIFRGRAGACKRRR